jgi:hypothetical protein
VAGVNTYSTGRRLVVVLVALSILAAPAMVLRLACVGNACSQDAAAAEVPFCPLPPALRSEIGAGFRQGRSPDVLAAGGGTPVLTRAAGQEVPWPAADVSLRVPIAFLGPGIRSGSLPTGTGLDQVAPTMAEALGVRRPHPEVAAGRSIAGTVSTPAGPASRLGVEIVWKGIGTPDLHGHWPKATAALIRGGATTLAGTVGSQPIDPAAVETTIGTGGLPFQHGITGTLLHTEAGGVVPAWSRPAPTSVITTLAEDIDHLQGERASVGLVAPARTDLGLIGDGWYLGSDRDQHVFGSPDPVAAVSHLLRGGYGTTGTTDLLGVVLKGSVSKLDRHTAAIIGAVLAHDPGATIAVTATGSLAAAVPGAADTVSGATVARRAASGVGATRNPVAAETSGGLFLDPAVLEADGLSADAVVQATRDIPAPDGTPLFADAYPGFSVAFARYC